MADFDYSRPERDLAFQEFLWDVLGKSAFSAQYHVSDLGIHQSRLSPDDMNSFVLNTFSGQVADMLLARVKASGGIEQVESDPASPLGQLGRTYRMRFALQSVDDLIKALQTAYDLGRYGPPGEREGPETRAEAQGASLPEATILPAPGSPPVDADGPPVIH